ncbi:hypothetical protein XpCFBP7293_21370 [Xanthomonas perforans]|nr:hypothetical protein XpCFBP7293_21370 [Xanthomonas perforans]
MIGGTELVAVDAVMVIGAVSKSGLLRMWCGKVAIAPAGQRGTCDDAARQRAKDSEQQRKQHTA